MEKLKQLTKKYTSLIGNVGNEDKIILNILEDLKKLDFEINIDSIGNLIVHLTPSVISKKVMIFAHMDEVGMIVRKISNDGYIYIEKLGSINPNTMHGIKVNIVLDNNNQIPGVIGVKSHHTLKPEDKYITKQLTDIYIDVGAKSYKDVVDMGIKVGNPISFRSDYIELSNNTFSNKSIDDRALVSVLIRLLQDIDISNINCDLYIVFSVQEEFNTRGIIPAVRQINPDIVVGLDVTPACDTPDLQNYSNISVGEGISFTYMNHHSRGTLAGLAPNKKMLSFMEKVAKNENIKFQREVATGILTETAYISIENSNVSVANISIPTRYTHTPIEVASYDDLFDCYKFLKEFIKRIDYSTSFGKESLINNLKGGKKL